MHGCAYKRRRYHGSQLPTAGEGDSDDHCLPGSLTYQYVLDLKLGFLRIKRGSANIGSLQYT